MTVVVVGYDPASCGGSSSVRLGAAIAIYMAEPELCIGLVRRIVGILAPQRLVARGRKAPCTTCAVRSSVRKDRGQRHGSVVEYFLIRLAA